MVRRIPDSVAGAIFAFGVTLALQRGIIASLDGKVLWKVSEALVQNHNLTPQYPPDWGSIPLHTPYSSFALGTSLVLVPFTWLQRIVDPGGLGIVTLANPVLIAIATGLLVAILGRLGIGRAATFFGGFGFLCASTALWHSTEVFSEPTITVALLAGIYGLIRWREGWARGALLVGLGYAACVLTRVDSVFTVLPMLGFIPFAVDRPTLANTWKSWIPKIALPLAAAFVVTAWYNLHRYGSLREAGYPGFGFTTPFRDGLDLLLLAPGKNIFLYGPIAILGVVGLRSLMRRQAWLAGFVVFFCVTRIIFFARWVSPEGGVAWGPRFMLPIYAVLSIAAAVWIDGTFRISGLPRIGKAIFATVVVAFGLVVNLASVWVTYEQYYNEFRYQRPGEPFSELQARLHWFIHDVFEGHIRGNLDRLDVSRPFPLMHFDNGISVVGALAIGIMLLGIALVWVSRPMVDEPS